MLPAEPAGPRMLEELARSVIALSDGVRFLRRTVLDGERVLAAPHQEVVPTGTDRALGAIPLAR